jgi:hypothetical protein
MIVPKGFDGFVISKPFILMFCSLAFSNAVSKAFLVSLKLLELLQMTGTSSTPVLHFKSLSNLH